MQVGRQLRAPRTSATGFTLVWVLAVLAVMAIGLATVGPNWHDQGRRDREKDLLRIGSLYAEAISNYYLASPGALKRFPPSLSDLVQDRRFLGLRRHIRQLYVDPLNPDQPWGLIRAPDGGVQGVYSLSQDAPLRQEALDLGATTLPRASTYVEWKFVARVNPS